jgi:NTP pyrophosphatase (non-canonical NTP hydrolase)
MHRDVRQALVGSWAKAAFGAEQATNLRQRGVRMLEEAIELYQAVNGSAKMAHELVDYVFSREPGDLEQEIGGVGITLLALGHAAGVSAETAEIAELGRVSSKPLEHFRKRNEAKNQAGFLATGKPESA